MSALGSSEANRCRGTSRRCRDFTIAAEIRTHTIATVMCLTSVDLKSGQGGFRDAIEARAVEWSDLAGPLQDVGRIIEGLTIGVMRDRAVIRR